MVDSDTLKNRVDRFVGQTLDGKYRLDRLLGEGGMGAVYLATHLGTDRVVAVKLIAPRFMGNERFVARFKREARAAGRLRHPNIVDVTDFGFAHVHGASVAYLVMEYLDGCTLGKVLEEEQALPPAWVVDLLEQVCSAVHEAHRQGIIHRDLKPDNIWLEPNSLGGYRVKVLDFGIAKIVDNDATDDATAAASEPGTEGLPPPAASDQPGAADAETLVETATWLDNPHAPVPEPLPGLSPGSAVPAELTRAGALLGTPQYMSPEQCRGENLDARSDVYSLGVIAYLLLGGAPPFAGDSASVIRAHRENEPPPLKRLRRKLPRGLCRVVMSALAKDPAARPPSALAYAAALRANADDLGALYRRGFALYAEHFPTVLKLSLLAHVPVFLVFLLSLGLRWSHPGLFTGEIPVGAIGLSLLEIVANWITTSCIAGTMAILVSQLSVAPLREVRFRQAFAVLRQRWRPLVWTGVQGTLRILLGLVLLVIPGLVLLARYLLWAPVVMMEGLQGGAALKRSAALTARSRRDVVLATLFLLGVPLLLQTWLEMLLGYDLADRSGSRGEVISQFASLVSIVVLPLVSIVPALLYLKLRQFGGETLADIAALTGEPAAQRNWEQRMRERLTLPSTRKPG